MVKEIQLVNFQENVSEIIRTVINSHQPVLIIDKGETPCKNSFAFVS